MMATAEARAAWQRTANRCFVQEDAKRAPKLACCQSSSSSKPVDTGQMNPADGVEHPTVGFEPVKRSPSSTNLPSDLRWWLQMKPNYGHQRDLTNEQLGGLDFDTEPFRSGGVHSYDMLNAVGPFDNKSNSEGHIKSGTSADMAFRKQDLKTMYCEASSELSDMSSYYEVLSIECDSSSAGGQKPYGLGLDYEAPWIDTQKVESWWRTANGDELASLVLQKSYDLVDNCDLPPLLNTNPGWSPTKQFGFFGSNGVVTSSLKKKCAGDGVTNLPIRAQRNLSIAAPYPVQKASMEHFKHSADNTSSNSVVRGDVKETVQQMSLNDPSKSQLLEALCHSQTRAREAEKAAQQACTEKEHIMKLFFRQASHLFAYKQWFKLLQLEALYYQMKNKDLPFSFIFPAVLPWTPQRARKLKKSWQKKFRGKRLKPGHSRFSFFRYGLAVALGLGLVGAGLLIGWTVGWLFPAI